MTKTFNEKYYNHNDDAEIVVDPDLNVNLLKDKDFESSVDGDFEEKLGQELKQKVVTSANKRH